MKIYFAGSIRGGRQDAALYAELIHLLGAHGKVLTEHIGLENLESTGEKGLSEQQIFERDLAWIRESDAVVAEVTAPSLGVGWEIATAQTLGIPVLCLFRPSAGKKVSAMLSGNKPLQVKNYSGAGEAPTLFREFFQGLKNLRTRMVKHTGGCHCGAVRFEVDAPSFLEGTECDCEICTKAGFLHLIVPASRFRLLKGRDQLSEYQFHTRTARHLFCKTCGIKSFYVPRSNPDGFSVNIRCLDAGTVVGVKRSAFDSSNFEASAKKLERLSKAD